MLQETNEECNRYEEAEQNLLKEVDSFRRWYNSLYPSGPLLLLTPRNENDKVVSSQTELMFGVITFVILNIIYFSTYIGIT